MAAKAIRRKHLTLVVKAVGPAWEPDYTDQLSLGEPPCPTETLDNALKKGRAAINTLTAPPCDEHGYSDEEVAAQYAATDRLIAAFGTLDRLLADPAAAFTV